MLDFLIEMVKYENSWITTGCLKELLDKNKIMNILGGSFGTHIFHISKAITG